MIIDYVYVPSVLGWIANWLSLISYASTLPGTWNGPTALQWLLLNYSSL